MVTCIDLLGSIGNIICGVAAIVALIISVTTFVLALRKERKLNTLSVLSKIRNQYYYTGDLDDSEKLRYLNELEFFSTGVNLQLYSASVVYKMSGSRLITQYEFWAKDFISERRAVAGNESAYCEFESLIIKLMKMRKKNRWGKKNKKGEKK